MKSYMNIAWHGIVEQKHPLLMSSTCIPPDEHQVRDFMRGDQSMIIIGNSRRDNRTLLATSEHQSNAISLASENQ